MSSALGKIISISVGIVIVTAILSFLPITIGIPDEIYNVLMNNTIKDVFQMACYFFPVSFAFKCFLVVFIARHYSIIINFVTWLYNIITNN